MANDHHGLISPKVSDIYLILMSLTQGKKKAITSQDYSIVTQRPQLYCCAEKSSHCLLEFMETKLFSSPFKFLPFCISNVWPAFTLTQNINLYTSSWIIVHSQPLPDIEYFSLHFRIFSCLLILPHIWIGQDCLFLSLEPQVGLDFEC